MHVGTNNNPNDRGGPVIDPMGLAEALGLIEKVVHVEPGPWATATLRSRRGRRWANLSDLQVVDALCCWCNARPVERGRRKYCSINCVESASRCAHPQNAGTKAWLLINRQSCACAACGLDYSDEVVRRILSCRRFNERYRTSDGGVLPVTYFHVGAETGRLLEVDHIVPIHRGGDGPGLDNVQVICVRCHRRKSATENGERLKGLFRAT